MQLLDILDEQKALVENMRNAVAYGDKQLATELYEAIIKLDQNYQDVFEEYEGKLPQSDSVEISNRHYEIIKSMPSYSNLMQ